MENYDDIIGLEHHTSRVHPRMPREARAAQFAPFAAMVGHDAAIAEVERLTEGKITLDDEAIAALDERLKILMHTRELAPDVMITYFKPDERKEGGAYLTVSGRFETIDEYERTIKLSGGIRLPISDVVKIESPIFDGLLL